MRRLLTTIAVVLVAGWTFGVPARAEGAGVITHTSSIPGSYIVVLRDGLVATPGEGAVGGGPSLSEVVTELAAAYGAAPAATFGDALTGFAAQMDAADAEALANDPRVEYVEQDYLVVLDATQQVLNNWGLDRIDERLLPKNNHYTYSRSGAGVHAYVVDSGIGADANEFGGRLVRSFTAEGAYGDCNGHGSNVASILGGTTGGVAKGVTLHEVRVGTLCSCVPGTGTPKDPALNVGADCAYQASHVLQGINWVVANHVKPAVMNLSFGATQFDSNALSIETAVRTAVTRGISVVASAGNNNTSACNQTPARIPEVITVGAVDVNDARAVYVQGLASNYGSCLDLFAPGKNLVTHLGTWIGMTSGATPFVAGAAALYLEGAPAAAPAAVASYLVANATTGRVSDAGAGSPNRLLFQAFPGGSEVDNPPGVAFTYSCSPTTCTFVSNSVDDFAVTLCRWNFGEEDSRGHVIYRHGCTLSVSTQVIAASGQAELSVLDDAQQWSQWLYKTVSVPLVGRN